MHKKKGGRKKPAQPQPAALSRRFPKRWDPLGFSLAAEAAAELKARKKAETRELVDELVSLISCDEHVTSEAYPKVTRLLYSSDPKGILEALKERMESADESDLADCAMLVEDIKKVLPDEDFSAVRQVLERKKDELEHGWARDAVSNALEEIGC